MLSGNWTRLCTRRSHFGMLLILIFTAYSGCRPSLEKTYSVEEQYDLAATRSAQMSNQLAFSFRWVSNPVPFGQDIFFVATFTNTTTHLIVLRKPMQHGILEMLSPDTTLLFSVKPTSVTSLFEYPGQATYETLRPHAPIQPDEFVYLPGRGKFETRLKLPRFVFRNGIPADVVSLPSGQYLVGMTYYNSHIGYRIERGEERYVDVGAWVGQVESNTVPLTVTP